MIHLIVGNTGAGKTTYSDQLRGKTKGIVFSIDKWNKTLFFPDKKTSDGLEWFLDRIDRAEEVMLSLIEQLEGSGVDSILDLGLAKIEHRDKFRTFANANGYQLKIHFLDVSKETRHKRVMMRNENKGPTFEFEVTQENFDFMENWFEKPTDAEMTKGIKLGEERS